MAFAPAVKRQVKLRLCIFGPSGSGKTMSAIRIAKGMSDKVALIDTEHGSASYYAGQYQFDTLDLQDRTIQGYMAAIREAQSAGYPVVIIDSLTHAWQELLEQVDKWGNGNNWAGWRKGSPLQKELIEAILSYPGHLIATMRVKTEWATSTDERGKTRPVKLGLAPEQGKGIEYEFGLQMEMNTEHVATVSKDRTGRFQDRLIEKPGEDFGRELVAWLNSGEAPEPARQPAAASPPPARQATPPKADAPKPDWARAAVSATKPTTPDAYRTDLWAMLLAMHGDEAKAKAALAEMSSFTGKDKKVIRGKDDVAKLSDKAAEVNWGKAHKVYQAWLEAHPGAPAAPVAPAEAEHPNGDDAWAIYCEACDPGISEEAREKGWWAVQRTACPGTKPERFTAKEWARVIDYIEKRAAAHHEPEPTPEPQADADPMSEEELPF